MAVCLATTELKAHRTQGPIQGFREQYGHTPVVEKTVDIDRYHIYFCAFDIGNEVHMIAYARYQNSGNLYQDMVRVSVYDPDGNALTVYRDHVTTVLDEPIRWAYHREGLHEVTVELRPFKSGAGPPVSASFTMPLTRESPTSYVLVSATGIILVTILAVVIMKRRG
jgi:hypothetical protein